MDDAVELIAAPIVGLGLRNCRKARKIAMLAAQGPRVGWWKSREQFEEAVKKDATLQSTVGARDWAGFFDAISKFIAAIMAGK
jgi:hypothetical protein